MTSTNFDPYPYLPAWAQAAARPIRQALYMILALMDNAPCVDVQVAALRNPGTTQEKLRVIGVIEAAGNATPVDLLALLTAARGENGTRTANILVRPDPARDHPWLFLDDLPEACARDLAHRHAAVAVETSIDARGVKNCQVRLLADRPLSQAQRTDAQRVVQARLHGDEGSIAGEKWGRLPGFTSQKPGKKGQWTNLVCDTCGASPPISADALLSLSPQGGVRTSGGSLLSLSSPAAAASSRPSAGSAGVSTLHFSSPASPNTKQDYAREALAKPLPAASERAGGWRREYADACQALRAGLSHREIVALLAQRALERGKRRTPESAAQYAQQVLDAALKVETRTA